MEKYNLLNDLGWEIYPEGLFLFIKTLNDRYHLPIMITENGIPQFADRNRAPFIVGHLQQLSTVNRNIDIKSTGALTYPRHITEGALALQYIIANGKIEGGVERFGVISPKGNRVEYGSETRTPGAFWEGVIDDGTRFTLYLDRLQNDQQNVQPRFLGMVFYHNEQKWIRLSSISFEGMLRFSHEACAHMSKRDFEAKATGGDLTGGTLVEGNKKRSWSAKKLSLYGLWSIISGKPPFEKLYFSKLEGEHTGWKGKVLVRSPPA